MRKQGHKGQEKDYDWIISYRTCEFWVWYHKLRKSYCRGAGRLPVCGFSADVQMTKALEKLNNCEGIIIFTDLMGGTPFNVAAQLGRGNDRIRVLGGTNLPMLVEIVMSRKFMDDLDGLADSVVETGKEQVIKYEFKQVVQEDSEDGI